MNTLRSLRASLPLIRAIRVFYDRHPRAGGDPDGRYFVDVGPSLRGDDGNDAVNNHANRSKLVMA